MDAPHDGNSESSDEKAAPKDVEISVEQILNYAKEFSALFRSEREKQLQLEWTIKELERSNKDLEDFALIASHDLQEPLRKIVIFSDLLKNIKGSLDPRGIECLDRLQKATIRMQNYIDDLLQYSRITCNNLDCQNNDIKEAVLETIEELEILIQESNGEIIVKDLPILKVNNFHMKQLFLNLLNNALKFHRTCECPRIEIDSRKMDNEYWEIRISDNGIGFKQKYLDRIFKPFQRLNERSRFPGTGMGLAICKKIVEYYGGEIGAQSEPGKGSTFFFTLPGEKAKETDGGRIRPFNNNRSNGNSCD